MSKVIRLFDRSRTVTDWTCKRKRFWNYEYNGKGIVPDSTHLELFLGTSVHDGLSAIANNVDDIDGIAKLVYGSVYEKLMEDCSGEPQSEAVQFASEQATLTEGLIRGFHKHVWPGLSAQYPEVIAIEKEVTYPVSDGLVFMGKPDLVLANKQGEWVYVEYKTTSSKTEGWINSWNTAVQVHSTGKAIQHTLGTLPTYVQIVGLYKGYVSYGKQNSPFCYAYRKQGNPPFSQDQFQYEYKSGFYKFPTWEMKGGVKEWINRMPTTLLAEQFPMTPPIFVNEEMLEKFFRQQIYREQEIKLAMQMMGNDTVDQESIKEVAFPMSFSECNPGWGKPCAYRSLCFGPDNIKPEDMGFTVRESHHELERMMNG